MFSKQLNQIRIDLSIEPEGPLLIRSGRQGADPTRPDMECVRTTVEGRSSVYIPGSSLKGVLRAHAERLLRSEGVPIVETFSNNAEKVFKQKSLGPDVYSGTSPLGRTFGTLHLKSRVAVSDHIPGGHAAPGSDERKRELDRANATEQRNGVGIDRLMGSAKRGALFDQEVVVQGRFDGKILMRNVQLYQLALILLVLRDMDEGFVQLGSGTSRGNGWVRATIRKLVVETRKGKTPMGRLAGIGGLAEPMDGYDLFGGDRIDLPDELAPRPRLVWERLEVSEERVDDLAERLVAGPWNRFLEKAKEKQWKA